MNFDSPATLQTHRDYPPGCRQADLDDPVDHWHRPKLLHEDRSQRFWWRLIQSPYELICILGL